MIFTTTLLTSLLKLLLIPAYRSTDFEVHRNWLAITHNLPPRKWYFEATSQWTLDYPPLFAWFEYALSLVAYFFDPNMLSIDRLNYSSERTVLFQRLSVIVTDLVYALGVLMCCSSLKKSWGKEVVLPILLITNCGLLMVDHIHFQYNGFMYGILLISIAYMLQEKYLQSAFWFTILLNLKHIYVYLAPAYFIYLLRQYCLRGPLKFNAIFTCDTVRRFATLGMLVLSIFFVTFLPFYDHLPQVLSRLFPFKRGLCHAYWAPNVWAIYNTIDKIGYTLASKFNPELVSNRTASMTGGLVQEYSHSLLPNVTPFVTLLLTALFMLPAAVKLFSLHKPVHFLRCMVLCALTSFLFGWHVHEKAILMVIIPLSILSIGDVEDARMFLLLSTAGHYSLFPLLYVPSLLLVKVLLLALYTLYSFHSLCTLHAHHVRPKSRFNLPLLATSESLYLAGLLGVFAYENVIHGLVLGLNDKLPFLPLMVTSVYCAVGIVYCWARYYFSFLRSGSEHKSMMAKKGE
ncbi:unnamed protein product [Phyllotreta striolata]|uniref:Alpha-1,3-glucosyltransferase n=1 Tax=Phyllotreta striolata TaxID=444603 RepID=A0A9N9TWJ9_PHYSR|nr:unnamed protein product [Phyllotreta striolata]